MASVALQVAGKAVTICRPFAVGGGEAGRDHSVTRDRRRLIAGNWKMNGSRRSIDELVRGVVDGGPFEGDVLVLPPHVFIDQVRYLVAESGIGVGAQNLDWREKGAFTGEVSGLMLAEAGCSHCLVGHSERRRLFAESDEVVARKFQACRDFGLVPVLCVGETLQERQSGQTMAVVSRQMRAVLERSGVGAFDAGVIAYEPVWAIGTGESATADQAESVHAGIRDFLAGYDGNISANIRILYGGSVNGANAKALLAQENIDGALVGGASLLAGEFVAICRAAAA